MDFLIRLEESGLGTWVRESPSLWAYPTVLFLHTVGMAVVVGIASAIALRLLGIAPDLPLAPLESLFPIIWIGFWLSAISGTVLLIADASTKLLDPVFEIKMVCIVIALQSTRMMRRHLEARVTTKSKMYAAASLFFWTGTITAGRLMAYLGPKARL